MTNTYRVVDPATGEVGAEYPTATTDAMDRALGSATQAHREWSRRTTVAQRADLLRKVAALHEERSGELAAIIQREMGKPLDQAVGEVEFSAAIYTYYADNAEKFLADEPIELLDGDGFALVRRQPIGALLGVMPWNYPYYQVARFAAPTWLSATRSCSSTHRSARSPRPRSSRSSPTPASPRAPTSTSTRRTTRSPR